MKKQRILFDDNWLFHDGEIYTPPVPDKSTTYIQAKKERKRTGPAARDYHDSPEYYAGKGLVSHDVWTRVDLPHDYIIGQTPDEKNNECLGFFDYHNAWYRKHFTLPELPANAKVILYFEGVAVHCEVYANGCYVCTNRCGYTSFEADITDCVDFGAENVIAVHVLTDEHEGWWYEGGGIYRHVWLETGEDIHIARDGIFCRPEIRNDGKWTLPVDVDIENETAEKADVDVCMRVYEPMSDKCIAFAKSRVSIEAGSDINVTLKAGEMTPKLWDIEAPRNLYRAEVTLTKNGDVLEENAVRFGFRTIRFDAEHGFFLNGRRVQINGVCCHQDYGLTGKAVPDIAHRYKLELMKEMGANGYRCSHYPHSASVMDMLDELGFLVMAETRWFDSTPEGLAQLDMLIKRDRNHPSVVLWSAGNEEPFHLTQAGYRTAVHMMNRIRRLDPTRPVTTAVSNDPINCPVLDAVDVIGVNYNMEQLDAIHARYSDKPVLWSECCATGTTRGWYYADDPARGYINAYDRDTNNSFRSRENTWRFIKEREWLAGGYQWAGVEHRGEAKWPRLCSQSGAVDLYLQKKDAFYQNRAMWTQEPMAHILPHWNHNGYEGENIRVSVYTNTPQAELFLNGESLGSKDIGPCGHAEWQVAYVPGKLEVKCPGAYDCAETTGSPYKLRIVTDRCGGRGDHAVLTCDCIDTEGRHVPDAEPFVRFITNSNCCVIGTGSDISDHMPVTCPDRKMRAGYISLIVKLGDAGECSIRAEAEGLLPAYLKIIPEDVV